MYEDCGKSVLSNSCGSASKMVAVPLAAVPATVTAGKASPASKMPPMTEKATKPASAVSNWTKVTRPSRRARSEVRKPMYQPYVVAPRRIQVASATSGKP